MSEITDPAALPRFAPGGTYIFADENLVGVIEGALVHLPQDATIDLRVVGRHSDALVVESRLYLDHKSGTEPGEAWIGISVTLAEPGANDALRDAHDDFRGG